jgi:hypothetical protein
VRWASLCVCGVGASVACGGGVVRVLCVMLLCTLTRTRGVNVCCGATTGDAGVWMAAALYCTYDV